MHKEIRKAPVVLDKQPAAGFYMDHDVAVPVVQGRTLAVVYAQGNSDNIIPKFITSAMPHWFSIVFLLTLLAAAMSTLSSQCHTMGTGIGRDVFEQVTGGPDPARPARSVLVVRLGIVVGIIVATSLAYWFRSSEIIIARATAIFFGLCARRFCRRLWAACSGSG